MNLPKYDVVSSTSKGKIYKKTIDSYSFWKVDGTASYINQPVLIEKLARANETLKRVGMPKSFTR